MTKVRIAIAAVPFLVAVTAAEAQPTADLRAEPELEAEVAASSSLGGTLYDQTDDPAGVGFSSQIFEPVDAAFDCRAADDFSVPAADEGWNVGGVRVLGSYLNGPGPAPLVDVEFFSDLGGLPAEPAACSYLGLESGVDFTDDGAGSFEIFLPTLCQLAPGDYWLSVRVQMDRAVGGQWLWSERSTQTGAEFLWENPGDGFGTGCLSWQAGSGCGAAAPDLLFALDGAPVPVELQTFTVD